MNLRRTSAKISSIDVARQETWSQNWFLTFDMDWASDAVIEDTLGILDAFGVKSTWLVTHETKLLTDLRCHSGIELGIHPNFNGLLEGEDTRVAGSARDVVRNLVDLVPEANVVRSHSIVQSSPLLDVYAEHGLTHDVNTFIPSGSGITCWPWRSHNGMTRVPYVWEDDTWCVYEATKNPELSPVDLYTGYLGVLVINFHPIHIYLNTERLDRYKSVSRLRLNAGELLEHRFKGYGTRNRLIDLLSTAAAS